MDIPFVLSTNAIEVEGTRVKQLVLVVTTISMLRTAVESSFLCVDGTYNLSLQRTVGIVVGSLDPSKKLHPVALAIVISENSQAYCEVIRQINNACESYFNKKLQPLVLQADGAWQITTGVMDALTEAGVPPPARASCWYHVKAKIRSNLLGAHRVGKPTWGHIASELDLLKESFSPQDFQAGVDLFFSKWFSKCNAQEYETGDIGETAGAEFEAAEEAEECESELGVEDVQNLISEAAITSEDLDVLLQQKVVSVAVAQAVKSTFKDALVGRVPEGDKGLRSALNYLRSEYLNPNHFRSNFYAGCLPEKGRWCSKTNCALEGFNNSLKTVATNNRVPSLEGLLRALVGSPMMNISMESRNTPADKPPTPSREMLREGALLHDHFAEVALCVSDRLDLSESSLFRDKTVYVFKNEDVELFDLSRIETFLLSKHISFKDFRMDKKELCAVCWGTEASLTLSPPEGLQCTCCLYNRKNVCSHVICMAIVAGSFRHDAISRIPVDRRTHNLNSSNLGTKSKYGILGPVIPKNVNGRTVRKKNMMLRQRREGFLEFVFYFSICLFYF
jgi:hypothetical protein